MRQIEVAAHADKVEPYLGFGAYIVPPAQGEDGTTYVNVPDAHAQWLKDRLSSGLIHTVRDEDMVPIRFDGAEARNMLTEFLLNSGNGRVVRADWLATDLLELWMDNGYGILLGRIGEPR